MKNKVHLWCILCGCAVFMLNCENEKTTVVVDGGANEDAAVEVDLTPTCTQDDACANDEKCVGGGCVSELQVWPNSQSRANSDPWLSENHAEILQMRPRVLALNFVNAKDNEKMRAHMQRIVDAMAEGSRYRGYEDPNVHPFLKMELAYLVDLRDDEIAPDWTLENSTQFPREEPKTGMWGFDYEQLFSQEFAELLDIKDPEEPNRVLNLCELVDKGLVHDVWIWDAGDTNEVSGAEILEIKPFYDENRVRVPGNKMERCAGNGCFDLNDVIPTECKRTVRIGWVNSTRGPGCFMESLSHGFESIAANHPRLLPTLNPYFLSFAGFDLRSEYEMDFDSWYGCSYETDSCLNFPTETSVEYDLPGGSGTIEDYVPVCGNVHFIPNGRAHYDLTNPSTVQSTCEGYRMGEGENGQDLARPFNIDAFAQYNQIADDCMGPFLVYWWQNFPGIGTKSKDMDGKPMISWWPYVYY